MQTTSRDNHVSYWKYDIEKVNLKKGIDSSRYLNLFLDNRLILRSQRLKTTVFFYCLFYMSMWIMGESVSQSHAGTQADGSTTILWLCHLKTWLPGSLWQDNTEHGTPGLFAGISHMALTLARETRKCKGT